MYNFTLYMTTDCNFKCQYCYEDYHNHYQLNEKTLVDSLEFMMNYGDRGKDLEISNSGIAHAKAVPKITQHIKHFSIKLIYSKNSARCCLSQIVPQNLSHLLFKFCLQLITYF